MKNAHRATLAARSINWSHPAMPAVRQGYHEIKHGLAPNYDSAITYRPGACANYERARLACLDVMRQAGKLPVWRAGTRIPVWLSNAISSVNQEIRLGLEANLVVDLSPGEHPVSVGEVY